MSSLPAQEIKCGQSPKPFSWALSVTILSVFPKESPDFSVKFLLLLFIALYSFFFLLLKYELLSTRSVDILILHKWNHTFFGFVVFFTQSYFICEMHTCYCVQVHFITFLLLYSILLYKKHHNLFSCFIVEGNLNYFQVLE